MITLCLFVCWPAAAQVVSLDEPFKAAELQQDVWRVSVGGATSLARLEPRGDGQCLHLFGDRAPAEIATRKLVPDLAYQLEYDFFQPGQETGGYQAVAQHRRPQGSAYWWLEYGPERFFLYTIAGGQWYNRWQAGGFPADRWYRVRVRNTPTAVRISLFDDKGEKLLAESPSLPHDDGDPGEIAFAAMGNENGVWGMKVANIHLAITPVAERDDYRHRQAALEAAQAALGAEETRRLWPEAAAALQPVRTAFETLGKAPPDDWPAYAQANLAFDVALSGLADEYHGSVLARLAPKRGDWVLVDLWPHFARDAGLEGLAVAGPGPLVEAGGVPFLVLGFGRNCVLQDQPSRSEYALKLAAEAKRLGLLLAPLYDAELYGHDDSLVDVLQVELRYADGFRERVVPVPSGWQPPLAGVGRPPMENGRAGAYLVEPGHAAPLSEVVLCDAATQAGWALLGLSYQPGLPTEVPVIRAQAAPKTEPPFGPAEATRLGDRIVFESPSLRLTFDAKVGLLRGLWGFACGDLIRPDSPSPIFAVKLGDRLVYSDEFALTKLETPDRIQGVLAVLSFRGPGADGPLEVTVTLDGSSLSYVGLRAEMRNVGQQAIEPRLVFPLLDGLDFGERPGWWFPQRGGAASDLPLEGLAGYGGMAWLQLLDARRAGGGGLYLRCNDIEGGYKVLGLRSAPDEQAKPLRVAEIPEPAHPVDPWRARRGVHLSVQYLPRALAPGESWSPPPSTLAVHPGDWHAALADYRTWLQRWWKPVRPCPDRYRYGFYALVGGTPRDDQRGEEFGSYDWWHLSPLWSIDYPDELKRELDDLTTQGQRAAKWEQSVGLYIEGMCLEKKRRIAREHGAEWAMQDDRGAYYTYYSTDSNPVWNVCPAVRAWQDWDAAAYAEIARRVPLAAMYVDSTGSRWAEVCYNPAHRHDTPGIWPRGCGELFEGLRQAVMKVSPETAIHSEEPGCDYMALHEDGSWSHSLWTNFSGDAEYNPAGLNYFHFALPEFKMYEIPSYRHALWRCKLAFFNGEGLWTNVPDALRRELFVRWFPTLREHAETFLGTDAQPALPVVSPPVYANAFRRGPQAIYTLYNAGLRTQTAEIAVPLPTAGHVFDLLGLRELPFEARGTAAWFRVTLDPHDVQCLLVTPRAVRARALAGDRLEVSAPGGALGGKLLAVLVDEAGVRREAKEIEIDEGRRAAVCDLGRLFGDRRGRVLLRLAGPYATADETVVPWR